MWCVSCRQETDNATCPLCGEETCEEALRVVFWCDVCNVPVLHTNDSSSTECPRCGSPAKYLCADIRPVFPEERLLFEIMRGEPLKYVDDSVWALAGKYYVNGRPVSISNDEFSAADTDKIRDDLEKYQIDNRSDGFDKHIAAFLEANRNHEEEIKAEAFRFVKEAVVGYPEENIVVSFSGGKDSTAAADIAVRALGNPYLVHVFGDTTLEFPSTYDYVKRFRNDHPLAIFKVARNSEQSFYDVAEVIGPPARMMRWCCSMFKTGPISRVFNGLYKNQDILTFYGIRKSESVSRSKYNRIEDDAESVKIQRQKVASPVFFWKDAEVWLYILAESVDFNDAYRLGYERVGCWCCPNNNPRAQFLSAIYMADQSREWRDFLIGFARRIGKPDPEVYVDTGKWKARQGGNGLAAARSVKVKSGQCATEDNAMTFALERPFSDELVSMLCPIGRYAPGLGRSLLGERVFVDPKTDLPLFAVMPFKQEGYEYAMKLRILDGSQSEELVRMVKYQVVKHNACRQCLKCESLCKHGAITIKGGFYSIDERKCAKCKQCVMDKYLEGGCLMSKYLRTKEQA